MLIQSTIGNDPSSYFEPIYVAGDPENINSGIPVVTPFAPFDLNNKSVTVWFKPINNDFGARRGLKGQKLIKNMEEYVDSQYSNPPFVKHLSKEWYKWVKIAASRGIKKSLTEKLTKPKFFKKID